MRTDTTEKGLESIIVRSMTGRTDLISSTPYTVIETAAPVVGGSGWLLGDSRHYDRGACVDLVQLRGFIRATQPKLVDALMLEDDAPARRQFLARLEKEVARRGVIDVLRKASNTARIISTSSTARRHPGTRRPASGSRATASA